MDGIRQKQTEDLYKNLQLLAINIDKSLAAHRYDLEYYSKCAGLLSEIRCLMSELTKTKMGNNFLPLLNRYIELEGKAKEMRNDLSLRNA